MSYPVGEVARASGVTVRTLHHYDQIGLLSPGGRTATGYRRYTDADLERLQHILSYRQLGFRLDQIAAILSDPETDVLDHLRRQHSLLVTQQERLQKMIDALEFMMEARQMGIQLTPEERFEVFGDFDPGEHAAEAEQRWGDTEAYRESQRRVARFTKADWQQVKEEGDGLMRRMAAAMTGGLAPDSVEAMDLAEEHRSHIGRFYDCTYDIHRGLADMYTADERFTRTIDGYAPGLAAYLREAILANSARRAA